MRGARRANPGRSDHSPGVTRVCTGLAPDAGAEGDGALAWVSGAHGVYSYEGLHKSFVECILIMRLHAFLGAMRLGCVASPSGVLPSGVHGVYSYEGLHESFVECVLMCFVGDAFGFRRGARDRRGAHFWNALRGGCDIAFSRGRGRGGQVWVRLM